MPRPKKHSLSDKYMTLVGHSRDLNETNDCSVKAIALVTGVDYMTAHAAMRSAGRQERKGSYWHEESKALKSLGFGSERIDLNAIIRSYPKPHCRALKNVTTYHPRRFPEAFAHLKGERVLLWVSGHMAAMVDGEVHDWSTDRALRVYRMLRVFPV